MRELVLFTTHSVLKDPSFLRLDLVTCRNLLICLERQLQGQLGRLFHYALKPRRYLFLGSAETVDATPKLFDAVDREARLYCMKPQATRVLPLLPQLPHGRRHDVPPVRSFASAERNRSTPAMHLDALERDAPPSVLVDAAHRIVNLSPTAGRFIQHSAGLLTTELAAVVRPELRLDLKIALERAFEQKRPSVTLPASVAFNGSLRRIVMHVTPAAGEATGPEQALVFFLDCGDVDHSPADAQAGIATEPDEVRRLHDELKAAHEWLNISRSEHETAIQALRAANEELQSINEEYGSTSEELETSKEELQSMNGELQAVNAELKDKLDSLAMAHSDLQNLTMATEIGTLFLDPELRIRMFTPPVADLFNITQSDIGREITDFTHRLIYDEVAGAARRVLRDLAPIESEVESREGRWYMMRLRPYRTIEDRIDGIVVTFIDISRRVETENRLRESEERYRLLFDSIDEGFCVIEMLYDAAGRPSDYRFLDVNAAFGRQTGLQDVIGRTIRSVAPRHEEHWFEIYGRIVAMGQAERFENPAAELGRYYEVYAFPVGAPDERRLGVLFNDISARKNEEKQRELLTNELAHRVKNLLAVVQALATQTNGRSRSIDEFRSTFVGRLQALGRAHGLLVSSEWRGADLKKLVDETVAIYGPERRRSVEVNGAPVPLTPKQALGLSLVLHELATNAVKYGSLSVPKGRLNIAWQNSQNGDRRTLHLRWRERGGPAARPPSEKGFGTQLVERACGYELDGTVELDYSASGLTCEISLPLA